MNQPTIFICMSGFLAGIIGGSAAMEWIPIWLQRRRSEKFIEICGKRFHTKVIAKYIQDRRTFVGSRDDVYAILVRFNRKLMSLHKNGYVSRPDFLISSSMSQMENMILSGIKRLRSIIACRTRSNLFSISTRSAGVFISSGDL